MIMIMMNRLTIIILISIKMRTINCFVSIILFKKKLLLLFFHFLFGSIFAATSCITECRTNSIDISTLVHEADAEFIIVRETSKWKDSKYDNESE